jgi:hypothetical protein
MNGLCEQCQVYYPMPEDFGRGVPYACPQCQALLVPYVTEGEAAAPEAGPTDDEAPTAEVVLPGGDAPAGPSGPRDEDVPTDEVHLPPPPLTGPPPTLAPSPDTASGTAPGASDDDDEDSDGPSVITQVTPIPDDLKKLAAELSANAARDEAAAAGPPGLDGAPGPSTQAATRPDPGRDGTTPAHPTPPPLGIAPDPGRPARVFWFHPQISPEVQAARAQRKAAPAQSVASASAMANASSASTAPASTAPPSTAPEVRPPPPSPPPSVSSAEPAEKTPGAFHMKGAGTGVSRESLPLDGLSAPAPPAMESGAGASAPATRPSPPVMVGHRKGIATSAAPPEKPGRGGWMAAAGLIVILGGAGGTWWALGMPGLGADVATGAPAVAGDETPPEPAGLDAEDADHATVDEADEAHAADGTGAGDADPGEAGRDEATAGDGEALAEAETPDPPEPAPAPLPERTVAQAAPPAKARPAPAPSRPAQTRPAKATAPRPPPPQAEAAPPPPREPAPAAEATAQAAPEPTPEAPSARERARQHVREGGRLAQQQRFEEAIGEFERAILLDERNAQAHRGLGISYASLGRAEEAARQYEIYLRLNPNAPDAERVRAIIEAYYASQQ